MNRCHHPLNRRRFLTALSAGLTTPGLTSCNFWKEHGNKNISASHQNDLAWALADNIVRTTPVPLFPAHDFLVTDFGAATTNSDNTKAIADAITACHNLGGGRVRIPAGIFHTGPIHLLSNVNLHVDEGCKLLFSTNPNDYLPAVLTRWEGMEMMGLSPLIYAIDQNNIALTGTGVLDGQANEKTWWPWKGGKNWAKDGVATQDQARAELARDTENNRPVAERVYAEGAQLRPPFVQFYRCKNILIEGVTITSSPFWLLNPVLSENVTIRAVTCSSLGPNSDGCDPESCTNVIIDSCFFDTGDDCIAIKSGRNADGRRLHTPSKNIVIRNCKMRNGHGGIVIGSEISGGAHNIFAENCEMSSRDLERGLRIKTNSVRGGVIENIYLRNITIGDVQTAIVIDFSYEEGDTGNNLPQVKNINVQNLRCKYAKAVFNVSGYERAPIHELHLNKVIIEHADTIGVLHNMDKFSAQKVMINGKKISI